MKSFFVFFTLFNLVLLGQSEYDAEKWGYVKDVTDTKSGVVFTDNMGSALYLLKGGVTVKITEGAGCGNYFTYDRSANMLGYKRITPEGGQVPVLYDLENGKEKELWSEGEKCGQVSFGDGGVVAFTIDEDLIIMKGEKFEKHELGSYANIAPISRDARFAVFNDLGDNLWVYDIAGKTKRKITDGGGYYYPEWAKEGKKFVFRSFTGKLFIYDAAGDKTYDIGEGDNPEWSENGEYLIFNKKTVKDMRLAGSDIFIVRYDGTGMKQLTSGTEIEMEPAFAITGKGIIYHNYNEGEIIERSFDIENLELINGEKRTKPKLSLKYYEIKRETEDVKTLDIPYVNQVYDTPDWHNGHSSCGATAGVMTLAYFNILPKWEGFCSTPSQHYNNYGRYVAEKYRFREKAYDVSVNDPNGNPAWGGHGNLWYGGSPRSKMTGWLTDHRVVSTFREPPTYDEVVGEINANYPYTLCVMLTSAGHIIVAHGIQQERTLIFNDPYGNKNYGYLNWSGKNVKYDWPGYSNGYSNLVSVEWGIKTRFNMAASADSVVDDGQLDKGFYLHTKYPTTMYRWRDMNVGYGNNHMWYAFSTASTTADTCYATWKPKLSKDGAYEVFVYIPFSNATSAIYKVYNKDGMSTVVINQKIYASTWVSLGTFNFAAAGNGYVRLGDGTGTAGQQLIFDAVKFNYKGDFISGTEVGGEVAAGFKLFENYPNPFNPSTLISYELPDRGRVTLRVYDVLGKEVAELVNMEQEAGSYKVNFGAADLPSGIYICELRSGRSVKTIKMSLIK